MDLFQGVLRATENIFLKAHLQAPRADKVDVLLYVAAGQKAKAQAYLKSQVADWQLKSLQFSGREELKTDSKTIWLLSPTSAEKDKKLSLFGQARDLVGAFWRGVKGPEALHIHFIGAKNDEVTGALVGIGLANYKFLDVFKAEKKQQNTNFYLTRDRATIDKKSLQEAVAIYSSMNLSRHLSNLPGGLATPPEIAALVKRFFASRKNLKTEVWTAEEIKNEGMGLLYGVGFGSQHGSRLLRLRYRPSKAKKTAKPIAIVGKGVTFDTGGLDIKPSAGMRWMKKDMSGAATVAGLCHYVTTLELDKACDFYLPLAENAVSDRATRPGDIHKSYNGLLVEIDNTDAEGRLVMADAIAFAVAGKNADAISELIDVSTLTGAMRVAVGLDVAGYFCTDDKRAARIQAAAEEMGEMAWRMPLVQKYVKQLKSNYADIKNSSETGFGGAITAALFLQRFVGDDVPWTHFDVMSWNNSADGAICEGANAQCFQILARYLN